MFFQHEPGYPGLFSLLYVVSLRGNASPFRLICFKSSLAASGSHDLASFKVRSFSIRVYIRVLLIVSRFAQHHIKQSCSAQVSSLVRDNHAQLLIASTVSGEVPQQPVASRKSG